MNLIGFLGAAVASTTLAVGAIAGFNHTLDNTRIREAAINVHEIALIYRSLHCDLPNGTTVTSAQIITDTNIFPFPVTDPAFGWFTWSYLAGDPDVDAGSLVVTSADPSTITGAQLVLGGQPTGSTQLVVDLPNTRSLHLPDFAGATDERWDYTVTPPPTASRCF